MAATWVTVANLYFKQDIVYKLLTIIGKGTYFLSTVDRIVAFGKFGD